MTTDVLSYTVNPSFIYKRGFVGAISFSLFGIAFYFDIGMLIQLGAVSALFAMVFVFANSGGRVDSSGWPATSRSRPYPKVHEYFLIGLIASAGWFICTLAHEGGHALAGALAGMDPISIKTVPPYRFETEFAPGGAGPIFFWATAAVAGPLAGILFGLIPLYFGYRWRESAMGLGLRVIGYLEIINNVYNLIPFPGLDGHVIFIVIRHYLS